MHKKVHLISLGCDKNLVDSEKTLALLGDAGYSYTDDPYDADVIIVNTCCFIRDARDESIETLIRMADLKSELGKSAPVLVVMGCMAERYKDEVMEAVPEVDVLVGANSWQDTCAAIDRCLDAHARQREFRPISDNTFTERAVTKRLITAGGHYAYLKIAEGCGKNCTYCIIPHIKGKYRSVPIDDLITEAKGLAASGVKELILIAQETTIYGTDLYGRKLLPELLRRLNDIDGLRWIRLMYCYPEEITDELIEAIRDLPKVCHYIDMPVQHASDHILQRMARAATHDEIIERIGRIREMIPDVALRTTLISGFPGETDADHKILLEFVDKMGFDRLGDFEYSREEGTPAAGYSHQVSAARKRKRRNEVMELQQTVSKRRASERIGRELDVIIEGKLTGPDAALSENVSAASDMTPGGNDGSGKPGGSGMGNNAAGEGNVYVGRTYMDAPDVDGYIYIPAGNREFMTGDFVRARVTGASEYDLIGELI